jgi:GT2 family glycosyltransferase
MNDAPGSPAPRYSILIIGYRSLRFLEACFDSLMRLSGPSREILFLSNNSPEPEADWVSSRYGGDAVRVFRSERNLFFTGGVNDLVSRARGEYVVLLNPDTTVHPDWLQTLDAHLQATGYDGANSEVREMSDPDLPKNEKLCLDPFGRLHFLPVRDSDTRPIFVAGGCGMAMRRRVFLEAGGMDEDFKMYFDEVDLCWRLNLTGHRIGHAAGALIYHVGQGSASGEGFLWNRFRGRRNRIWSYFKNAGLPLLLVFVPTHLLLGLASVLVGVVTGRFREAFAELAALGAGFFRCDIPLSKRREVQKARKVSDGEFFRRGFFISGFGFLKRGVRSGVAP